MNKQHKKKNFMEHEIVGSHPDAATESNLPVCYIVSPDKQVTDVSKNRSVFIFRVMQCQTVGLHGFIDLRHSKMLTWLLFSSWELQTNCVYSILSKSISFIRNFRIIVEILSFCTNLIILSRRYNVSATLTANFTPETWLVRGLLFGR
jgi:hypothetical protein